MAAFLDAAGQAHEDDPKFPEWAIDAALQAQCALIDFASRQFVRAAVHAANERRKLAVGSSIPPSTHLKQRLLMAPFEGPDLFGGGGK